jgi:hypothetical protein
MSKLERYVYLRNPDTRRVLQLASSNGAAEFLHRLQQSGYLLATQQEWEAQEEARWLARHRREVTA